MVAIVIIAAAILFFLWRRRSSQAKEASGLPEYDDATAWQEVRAKYQSSEMPDNFVVRNELDASSVPQELASEPWKAREA